jgi:phosphate transport system substrate-binding protein
MTLKCLLLSGTALLSSAAFAETTLRALDGSFEMKGQSVTFDESNYFLQTPQGELVVQREFVTCLGEGCPADEGVEEVDDRVELVSLDGSFALNGTLLEVTATDFIIRTGDGSVTVQREFMTCEGAACPSIEVDRANFSVAVADSLGADLLSKIITDFAESKDFSVTLAMTDDESSSTILVGDAQGAEVANINLNTMDASMAIQAVLDGDAAFALTQETLTTAKLSELTGNADVDAAELFDETTIGLDAVSFVINRQNRINVLGIDDVRDVLTGDVTNWSGLGGADAPINVHLLSDNSGVNRRLDTRLLAGAALAPDHNIHDTASALNAAVQADPNAIGAVYRSQVLGTKELDLVSECNIFFDNSDFAVQTEEYPLTVRWNQYQLTEGGMPEFARNISDFVVTDFGQRSVSAQGLIAQELRVLPIKDQGARLLTSVLGSSGSAISANVTRQYFAQTANAERLSTSLRFLTGVARLDQKAVDDVKRISTVIRSDAYEGYEVLVFGFTDSVGTESSNISLGARRAEAVKAILLQENVGFLDDSAVTTFGMGPIAPVDCNNAAAGRDLNRRVEIWIRPRA